MMDTNNQPTPPGSNSENGSASAETGKRPEQDLNEAFLDSRLVTEGWGKLKTTLEQAIEAIPLTETERNKYKESVAGLSEVFDKLPVLDTERDKVAQRLEEAGFDEDAFPILYGGYRQRVQGIFTALENVIADNVKEVGDHADPEAIEEAQQQTRIALDFMARVSAQCTDLNSTESSPDANTPLRKILTTPFETFVEQALKNVDGSTNEQLSEYSRKEWEGAVRGIQEIIKDSGCYDSQEYPWITRAETRGSSLTEGEKTQESEKPIDERDEAYYKERFQRDIEIIKKRIREREQKGESPVVNTWGYDSLGRQQITEERGLLGDRYEESEEKQPKVNWFKRKVVVHEIDEKGKLKAVLREVKVAWPPLFEIVETGKGAKYGEATSERGYVHQEVRSVNTLANSPVLAWEWIQRLEAAETEERGGRTWHKVPILRNGEACWLPLSDEDYSMWMRGFRKTLSNFERAGLDFVSTKQQQERDDLETEHRIPDIGISGKSETWFDVQLENMGIEETFTVLGLKTPEERRAEFEHTKAQILEFCFFMATSYGLESEYSRIATEVIKSLGKQRSPENEATFQATMAEITQKFETVAQSMSSFSQSLCEVLGFLEEHSELMDTTEGWESFHSITESFLSLRGVLGIHGVGERAKPKAESKPKPTGVGSEKFGNGTGITSLIPESEEEEEETSGQANNTPPTSGSEFPGTLDESSKEYHGLVATFDPEITAQVVDIIGNLGKENSSFKKTRSAFVRNYHPDKYPDDSEEERVSRTRLFQAGMAYFGAISRRPQNKK